MTISSQSDLDSLSRIGRLVGLALQQMRAAVRPGVTTAEVDDIAATFLRRHGARSAPQLTYGFPAFTCISVNEQFVHGLPGSRVLRPRDMVKLDVSAELDGFYADSALTVVIPPGTSRGRRLQRCAEAAFDRAMAVARPGVPVAELGRAVEAEVRARGFHVARELCGHGLGRQLHEEPSVPNYYSARTRGTLVEGMVLAVEPMVMAGPARIVEEPDHWTLRTSTRCLTAHHEHTIVVRDGAPLVLTAV